MLRSKNLFRWAGFHAELLCPRILGKMAFVLYILAFVLIGATLLPLIKADGWWIRIFDFPRLQILFLAVANELPFSELFGLA